MGDSELRNVDGIRAVRREVFNGQSIERVEKAQYALFAGLRDLDEPGTLRRKVGVEWFEPVDGGSDEEEEVATTA